MIDPIERADALQALVECEDIKGYAYRQMEEAIKAIPSAETPQWIPCSERLPQIGQKVLASTKKTVFTQVFKGYYSEPNKWKWEHNSVKTIEAWMPLPTEYKGVNDE